MAKTIPTNQTMKAIQFDSHDTVLQALGYVCFR